MVICVDFDNVIHSYTSGYTEKPCDPPVPGALEFVHWLVDSGCDVVILTARIRDGRLNDAGNVRRWLDEHGFPRDIRVTNVKPPASLYVSKWAIRFAGDWDTIKGPPRSDNEASLKSARLGDEVNLSDGDWGYLGGLIDGEGCITGGVNGGGKSYVRLMVTNQHHLILRYFANQIGGSVNKMKVQPNHNHDVYVWNLSGIRMNRVLQPLLDKGLIRMKNQQAIAAIQYNDLNRYDGRQHGLFHVLVREQLIECIRSMNRSGQYLASPIMIDDRAWRFDGNFEPLIGFLKVHAFRPGTWNEAGWRLTEEEKTEWRSKGDK